MTDFSTDDARLDQRLSLLWDKITRISREVMTLKPRLRTIEKRLGRLEETTARSLPTGDTTTQENQP